MQIKTAPNVVSNNLNATTQYSIKASAKAFRILSDGLYSDKIAAPIRELSTNAYDAHVAKGNTHTPFDVHLPSVAEPWFAIRDYGIGMSKQELETTYTTYFESNKTHSNDFVGCMGLGSKTPFTLSDAFTVTSIKNGKKTTVINYLDADVPNFSIVSEENTKEASGTEIKFTPTESGHYRLMQQSADEILTYFDVTPNVTIGSTKHTLNVPKKILEGKDWYYVEKQKRDSSSVILMGNVTYPLSCYDIDEQVRRRHPSWEKQNEIRNLMSNLVFRVPIGNLDITASREEIGWNNDGKEYIVNFIERVSNEIKDIMTDRINKCKSYWDARVLFNAMIAKNDEYSDDTNTYNHSNGVISNFKWKSELNYKGNSLFENFHGTNDKNACALPIEHEVFWLGLPRRYTSNSDRVNRRSLRDSVIPFDNNVEFFVNDLPTGHVGRINHYVRNNENKVVVLLKSFSKREKSYLKLIGFPLKLHKTSSLVKPTSTRIKNSNNNKIEAFQYTGGSYWRLANNWDTAELLDLDNNQRTYYVPIKNWKIVHNDIEYSNNNIHTLLASVLGKEKNEIVVYGIKYGFTKKLKNKRNFVNVFDYITEFIKYSFKDENSRLYKISKSKQYEHHQSDGSYKFTRNLINKRLFKRLVVLLSNNKHNNLVKELNKINKIVLFNEKTNNTLVEQDEEYYNTLLRFTNWVEDDNNNLSKYFNQDASKTLCDVLKMLRNHYPMVTYMSHALTTSSNESWSNEPIQELINYIELVNNSKK